MGSGISPLLICVCFDIEIQAPTIVITFGPSARSDEPTMPSADFCRFIPPPRSDGSTWQIGRPPRVRHATFTLIPAASTSTSSVQVPGFEEICLLTRCGRLICDSCSSGQCFAFGFLQIPPHDGHPCRLANRSPCRADRGLSPPSHSLRSSAGYGAARHAWRTKYKKPWSALQIKAFSMGA